MATNSILNTSTGTTGQLLVAVTNSAPVFSASSSADFTFTSATASQVRTVTISNTDNTGSATSSANNQITVGGSNVGDPRKTFTVTGVTTWTKGIDNSDSDSFKISASSSLGTTDTFIMTSAGERTMPLVCAFSVTLSANATDVTGDGTEYTVAFNTTTFDQSSSFNTGTATFTAPVTGRYVFNYSVVILGLSAGVTSGILKIVTSNRTYSGVYNNWKSDADTGNSANSLSMSRITDMDAADTTTVTITASGGTKTADVQATSGGASTRFSGILVC